MPMMIWNLGLRSDLSRGDIPPPIAECELRAGWHYTRPAQRDALRLSCLGWKQNDAEHLGAA